MPEVTKRSVSTDALETLGTIIDDKQKRAGARLYPGQAIDVRDGIATPAIGGLGIVDPFLSAAVLPEQRFWMVLKPRIVTSLRHVWSHPAFADEAEGNVVPDADKAAARAALDVIADRCNISVDEMIAGANGYLDRGDYLCEGGRWEGVYLDDNDPFWEHFETLTGRKVPSSERGSFFSCSC